MAAAEPWPGGRCAAAGRLPGQQLGGHRAAAARFPGGQRAAVGWPPAQREHMDTDQSGITRVGLRFDSQGGCGAAAGQPRGGRLSVV